MRPIEASEDAFVPMASATVGPDSVVSPPSSVLSARPQVSERDRETVLRVGSRRESAAMHARHAVLMVAALCVVLSDVRHGHILKVTM